MKIDIQRSEELNQLLDALAYEIVDANIYHHLFCDLAKSISTHLREFRQSNTFWSLTIKALREARLTRLSRVYDQESKSLNLVNLLDTIKANLHLFEEQHFRTRLKGNAFGTPKKRTLVLKQLEIGWPFLKKRQIWKNNLKCFRTYVPSIQAR